MGGLQGRIFVLEVNGKMKNVSEQGMNCKYTGCGRKEVDAAVMLQLIDIQDVGGSHWVGRYRDMAEGGSVTGGGFRHHQFRCPPCLSLPTSLEIGGVIKLSEAEVY